MKKDFSMILGFFVFRKKTWLPARTTTKFIFFDSLKKIYINNFIKILVSGEFYLLLHGLHVL
jgi:hypothetical protein